MEGCHPIQGTCTVHPYRKCGEGGTEERQSRAGHHPQGREGLVLLGRWPVRGPRRMAGNKPGAKGGQLRALHHPGPSCLASLTHEHRPPTTHTHTPLSQWGPGTSKEPKPQTPSSWDPPTTLMLTPPATAAIPGAAETVSGPGSQASPALPASRPSSQDYEDRITNPISQVRKV